MTHPDPSLSRDLHLTPSLGPSQRMFDINSFALPPVDHTPSGVVNLTRAFTFDVYLNILGQEPEYIGSTYVGP